MDTKYPYIRQIKPDELAAFLNAKGSNLEAFKCPMCGEEHQSLVDNMPIGNDQSSEAQVVLQSVLPAFLYPESDAITKAIANGSISREYEKLTGLTVGFTNQIMYREVIHLICDNCGYIRTFSKDKILQWLINEGKFDAK